jgi:excisionase family DNA binding protein
MSDDQAMSEAEQIRGMLDDIARRILETQRKTKRQPFYTPKTLAEYLSISERTVYDLAARGKIPSYKVSGARRFDPRDVDEYLAKNRTGK